MAIGPDRVQVIVVETAALGGDAADETDYPHPLAAQEDALEACGFYFQDASNRDENVYIERNGNDMRFCDQNNTTPLTLSQLVDAGYRRHFLFMGV